MAFPEGDQRSDFESLSKDIVKTVEVEPETPVVIIPDAHADFEQITSEKVEVMDSVQQTPPPTQTGRG